MKKRLLLGSWISLLTLCSTVMPSAAEAKTQAKTVLTVWTLNGLNELKSVINDFEKKYPDIQVKVTTYGDPAITQAEQIAASSHSLPDIYFDWGGTQATFFEANGAAADLTPYIKQYGWDQRFSKIALQSGYYNGKFYYMPITMQGMGLFYRTDIFKKYGLKPPKTFDQLVSDAETLQKHNVTPFFNAGVSGWYNMRYMDAFLERYAGPKLHDQLMNLKTSWNNPAVVNAYTELKAWTDKRFFPKGFLALDPSQDLIQFVRGSIAIMDDGAWVDQLIQQKKLSASQVGFFSFPTDQTPNRISHFSQGWIVGANSTHIPEAVKFLDFYSSTAELYKVKALVQAPYANTHVSPPSNQPSAKLMQTLLAKAGGYGTADTDLPQQLQQAYFQANASVESGKMTPKQAAAFMQSQVEQYKQMNGIN